VPAGKQVCPCSDTATCDQKISFEVNDVNDVAGVQLLISTS
jgi:hypothetical protein